MSHHNLKITVTMKILLKTSSPHPQSNYSQNSDLGLESNHELKNKMQFYKQPTNDRQKHVSVIYLQMISYVFVISYKQNGSQNFQWFFFFNLF